MSKIPVQLLFTEDEFAKLQIKADECGLTVPLYIKSEMVQDDDFGTCYRSLLEKVDALPIGTRFNIRALFGVDWTMSRGVKLNLGKTFYNRIEKGVISNAVPVGKDSSNVMWYEKRERN
ncbi:MAG: single-stranded DNA-binding protein [Oscillospiraceae bacterium]|nr:single-stranded DNA-binding protein [Oscillospiraceae bacterium]